MSGVRAGLKGSRSRLSLSSAAAASLLDDYSGAFRVILGGRSRLDEEAIKIPELAASLQILPV